MSDSLMDLIKGAASKSVLDKLGGLMGTDEEKTGGLFEAAAGSILGGLIKKSESPGGADDIFKAAEGSDGGMLDKLDDILGGGSVDQDYEKQGGGILDMVFGESQGGILETLAKFLGFDGDIIKKLMTYLGPIVMGVIGKQMKDKALDSVGLGKLLGEQKSSLGNILPSGLTSGLGFGNLLGNVSDAAGAVTDKAQEAVGAAGGMAKDAVSNASSAARGAAEEGSSALKYIIPVILIAALAYLGYTFIANQETDPGTTQNEVENQGPRQIGPAGPPAADDDDSDQGGSGFPSLGDIVGLDFGDAQLGDFDLQGLKDQFSGISEGFDDVNMDNAQGLADKITGLTDGLEGMGFDGLPDIAKGTMGTMIDGFRGNIEGKLGSVSEQGILDILKPVLEKLWEAFNGLGFGTNAG
ncbi:MAG: DUF937 domain-containing protein [Planctomycetota bacterium]